MGVLLRAHTAGSRTPPQAFGLSAGSLQSGVNKRRFITPTKGDLRNRESRRPSSAPRDPALTAHSAQAHSRALKNHDNAALRRATGDASHSRHSPTSAVLRHTTPQPPLDVAGASHLSRPAHRQPGDVLQPISAAAAAAHATPTHTTPSHASTAHASTAHATAAQPPPACATSARPSPTHASATCATTSILSTALTSTAELGHRVRRGDRLVGGMDLRSPRSSPRLHRPLRPRPRRGRPRQSRCWSGAARTTQGAGGGGSGGRGVPRDVETRR